MLKTQEQTKESTAGITAPLTVSRPELLRDGTDDDFRSLVHTLLAFSARLQEIRNTFGACIGLTGIQYTILISIAHLEKEQGTGINRIASHLSLSGAFVTTEVKKLEAADLVSKHTNPADRRRVLLTVTQAGKALLAKVAPTQRPVNDKLFQCLSGADFDHLLTLQDGLLDGATEATSLVHYLREMT